MGWLFRRGPRRRSVDPMAAAAEELMGEIRAPGPRWRRKVVAATFVGPGQPGPIGPTRPPRVTDDDDDGLAGALVPKKPLQQNLSGGAALDVPFES